MSDIQVTPDSLRQLQTHCNTASTNVTDLQHTVNTQIESVDWHSPAATSFRGDWNTIYVPSLIRLQQALTDLGNAAATMASNYDSTEASYKGAGS